MQVTETLSQGLKREYDIFLPASDLAEKLNGQLAELKSKAQIKGFRPGKVPVEHLRKIYGKSVMADVVQEAITKANKQIVDDNHLRLAREPKVELAVRPGGDRRRARGARGPHLQGGARGAADVRDRRLLRDRARAPDDGRRRGRGRKCDRAAGRRAANLSPRSPRGRRRKPHDRVTVDFDGKIDGVPFEGGEGRDIEVLIGSNTFIPGFEDQLVGAVAGEKRVIHATFPETYSVPTLAGKTAEFDVTVKAIAAPEPLAIDDEFAKGLGFESLDKLKEMFRERVTAEYARASRDKVKRQLLDKLDALYAFELPEGLVNQEFDGIWTQVMQEQTRPAAASPTRTRPKRPPGRTTAGSPSVGCASACCSPKSEPRPR